MRKKIYRSLFIIALLTVIAYLGLYFYALFNDTLADHHLLFILSAFLVYIVTSFIYKLVENYRKSALIEVGIGIILILKGVFVIFPNDIEINDVIYDVVFHVLTTILLLGHVYSMYYILSRRQIARQINRATFDNHDVVFIDYNYKKRIVYIELSSTFASHYQALHTHFRLPLNQFKSENLHPDDYDIVTNINKDTIVEDKIDYQHRFRLKLPGMKDYSLLTISRTFIFGDHLLFVGFDLGLIEGIKESLIKKERELLYQAIETQTIIKGTNELVAKIDLQGNVLFATAKFGEIFFPEGGNLVGKNVFELNARMGQSDNRWFAETLKTKTTHGQSHFFANKREYWISWNNEALVNEKGEIESIITIGHDVTELIQLNKQLLHQSTHSALTGLLNQVGIVQEVETMDKNAKVMCFFLHLADLTAVTNYYGTRISEELIKTIAKRLSLYAKKAHLLSHYTYDQFVLMLVNPTDIEVDQVMMDMKRFLLDMYALENTSVQAKIDIGYAIYPTHTSDLKALISLASLATKASAQSEHNLVAVYDHYMTQEIKENIKLAVLMQQAILSDEMMIAFQHVVDVRSATIPYIEALTRWQSKTIGFVRPDVIFKTAKKANMVDLLDEYLVNKACLQFAKLKKLPAYQNTILTLNIATPSFMKPEFVNYLEQVVIKHGLHSHDIAIEVSENTFVHHIDAVKTSIRRYRQQGFLIAIDDFGREYSSLSILENIDYDIIKIDGTFVNQIALEKNQLIIEMITKINAMTGKIVIAESVETQFESDKLKGLNCYYHQGYFFHRPEKLID